MAEVAVFHDAALLGLIEDAEALFERKAKLNLELNVVWQRCKDAGYVPAIVRQMVKERAMPAEEREALYRMVGSYRTGAGLLDFSTTPLGQAAEIHEWPKPFAQQPVHEPGRRRKRGERPVWDADHPEGESIA